MPRRLAAPALLLALAAACGGTGMPAPAPPLPVKTWTWVDVPGTQCSDGSATGLAVSPGTDGTTVVFLDGGGACWDTLTCFTFHLAKPGPYAQAQWDAETRIPGSLLDRALPGSPFADATLVFVPYCTGDEHWGDATQDYPQAPRPWHHHGAENLRADVAWLGDHLPAPQKLVVSGSSAGGYGALLAFDLARQRWPEGGGYLVDDAGPPLVGDDIRPEERALWTVAWRLDRTLLQLCPDCALDLSEIVPVLAARHPGDRLALLSSRQDEVIRAFLLLEPAAFEQALLRLVDERFADPGTAAFLVPGSDHALLQAPAGYTAGDVPLPEWLRRMVEDDPAWGTAGR
ncbi:MAG: pectin acetylesterase-family hydrolase [Anaeromyxobacter sp.]